MKYLKSIFVIGLLMALIGFFSQCIDDHSVAGNDPRGDQFAGANACISCHKNLSDSYTHSDHYRTSSPVTKRTTGSFCDSGRFYFTDSSHVRFEDTDSGLYQSGFTGGIKENSGRFDIAFGSGEKAQTYGSWKENKLHQLPLTYYASMKTWANSPGFSSRHARFERIIGSRCFECHASYVNRTFEQTGALTVTETLDKNTIVYGIDCERCHGPALQHVKFQQENPGVKTARYITPIRSLTRQQQLDICAVCHSGNDLTTQRSLFTFTPGDTLSHFYYPEFERDGSEPDVHGKQLQLLQASLCFQKTNMTCTSCHDAHASPKDRMTVMISKCMDCHPHSTHPGINIASASCIDCHMPLQTSKLIHFTRTDSLGAGSKDIPYLIRTHKIAIYK